MTHVIALDRFEYAGKLQQTGTRFLIEDQEDLRLLLGFGKVRETGPEDAAPVQEQSASSEQPKRGRYKRRDMRATESLI